jgi:hypothetical protein
MNRSAKETAHHKETQHTGMGPRHGRISGAKPPGDTVKLSIALDLVAVFSSTRSKTHQDGIQNSLVTGIIQKNRFLVFAIYSHPLHQ